MSPTEFTLLVAAISFLTAALLYVMPVGECDQCGHCRMERLRRRETQHDRNHLMYGAMWRCEKGDDCPRNTPRGTL